MRSGICPKCRATEIFAARNGLGLGRGDKVGLRPHIEPNFRGMLVPHSTNDVWAFACIACGFTETYVMGAQAIDFIRGSWLPVRPQAGT